MSSPLVSIVIPAYNAAAFLAEAIGSALMVLDGAGEVIVVDDGSTDATRDVMASFGESIRCESIPNGGAPVARNRGLALARFHFVQFLDADDVLDPAKIRETLPLFKSDPPLDVIFTNARPFPLPSSANLGRVYEQPQSDFLAYMLSHPFQTACGLYRREALEKIGGFTPGLRRGQEYDLNLRLVAGGARFRVLPERLVGIRRHDSPHRITNQRAEPSQQLGIYLRVGELARGNPALTTVDREAIATRLLSAARACAAAGQHGEAAKGRAVARQLAPSAPYPSPSLVARAVARIAGDAAADVLVNRRRQAAS